LTAPPHDFTLYSMMRTEQQHLVFRIALRVFTR
jgi:hypothetical protein